MRIAALDIGGTSIKSGIWNGQDIVGGGACHQCQERRKVCDGAGCGDSPSVR